MTQWHTANIPENTCLFAIGDIHGYSAALNTTLAQIESSAKSLPSSTEIKVVTLGDYVDRGPDSIGVIDRLLQFRKEIEGSKIELNALAGNHDLYAMAIMDGMMTEKFAIEKWILKGGFFETLQNYLGQDFLTKPRTDFSGNVFGEAGKIWLAQAKEAAESWQDLMKKPKYQAHKDFLVSLNLSTQVGEYAFTHSGIFNNSGCRDIYYPGGFSWEAFLAKSTKMFDAVKQDSGMRWSSDMDVFSGMYATVFAIDSLMMDYKRAVPWEGMAPGAKIIVHGHRISEKTSNLGFGEVIVPDIMPYRIGLDTGVIEADRGGGLTTFWRYGKDAGFIRVSPDGAQVTHYKMQPDGQVIRPAVGPSPFTP